MTGSTQSFCPKHVVEKFCGGSTDCPWCQVERLKATLLAAEKHAAVQGGIIEAQHNIRTEGWKSACDEAVKVVDRRYCSAGHHDMIDGEHQLVVIMNDLRAAKQRGEAGSRELLPPAAAEPSGSASPVIIPECHKSVVMGQAEQILDADHHNAAHRDGGYAR